MEDSDKNKIVLDFNNQILEESFLLQFGSIIKTIMRAMTGERPPDIEVRGSKRQVSSFVKTLAGERKYIEAANKYGLTDPKTLSNKSELLKATQAFEKATGIKYPFR